MGKLGMIVLLAAALGVGTWWFTRPTEVVDLELRDASGNPVHFADMMEGKGHLVVLFAQPGCGLSKRSVELLRAQYPKFASQLAFAALYPADQKGAESFGTSNDLPFPIYGIKSAPDVFQVNDLWEQVGTSEGLRTVIWGGTIFVLDETRKLEFRLQQREVDELQERLAKLGYDPA